MQYWEYVQDVPHDSDSTYLESYFSGEFNVHVDDLVLRPCERIAAVMAALCWRTTSSGIGRPTLHVADGEESVSVSTPSIAYDTNFVFAVTSPATDKPWTLADVNAARVGAVAYSAQLRATQAGVHVFLYTPPVQLQRKERPMNFQAMEPLIANGADQAVVVPRGSTLIVHPLAANVEVRDVPGTTAKLTIPADSMVMLGPSYGQSVHLRADAGTVIELAVT